MFKTAKDALLYYGLIRTQDGKGVTIPSQVRYVYYFEQYLKEKLKKLDDPEYQFEKIIIGPKVNLGLFTKFGNKLLKKNIKFFFSSFIQYFQRSHQKRSSFLHGEF